MIKFLQKIFYWVLLKAHMTVIYISIALRNTEIELLKADPNDLDSKNKKETRKIHPNVLLEKFYAGQTDKKYVQEYYELLKKADKFMRTATSHQMAVAADKYGMNVGQKDQYGRRYDHVGFFDGQHKHAGKTMGEVLNAEMVERRTNDDDYELLEIFNNKPIEVGLSKIDDVVDSKLNINDLINKSKTFEFPIKITREELDKDGKEIIIKNKIEQLTDFLHVKKIGFEHRQLEFFIPLKYKTSGVTEGSKIFTELIDIKNIFIHDNYGELIGFRVDSFNKRINFNDTHEVWKFHGIEMKIIKQY